MEPRWALVAVQFIVAAMSTQPILIAVADPTLHPEARHIVAATGREVIDTTDPREIAHHANRVAAVLVDSDTAAYVASLPRHGLLVLLVPEPGPADASLVARCGADAAFLLPSEAPGVLRLLGQRTTAASAGIRHPVLVVCGTAGGSGASTMAAAIARTMQGVLVDTDVYSGGLDLLVEAEEAPGVRWNDFDPLVPDLDGGNLLASLPQGTCGTPVLTFARDGVAEAPEPSALAQVTERLRAHAPVILDVRVGSSLAREAFLLASLVVVCVPAEVRPASAAAQLVEELTAQHIACVALVRHRGWSGLDAEEVEQIAAVRVLAEVGLVPRLAKCTEIGGLPSTLPKPLRRAAEAVCEAARAA